MENYFELKLLFQMKHHRKTVDKLQLNNKTLCETQEDTGSISNWKF